MQSLKEDVQKIDLLTEDIVNLHSTLDEVCRHLEIGVPKPLASKAKAITRANGSESASGEDPDCEVSPPASPSAVQAPIDTFLEVAKLGSPGSADLSLTFRRSSVKHDLIGKGIISSPTAERLLDRYFNRLDHYLYGIASMYKDMASVRQASSILFAAMCTVSALHEPGPDQSLYESCNRELRRLVSRCLFEKTDVEFIRAMVIASFWLSDASRIFCANGIRRAADARLHRFFRPAVSTGQDNVGTSSLRQDECVDRARLWYLLFICDSHTGILHARDSLLRADREITNDWELFLQRPTCEDNDVRILSQTSLLLIMGQVRDTLGMEPKERLAPTMASQLKSFSRRLDKWHEKFVALFRPNDSIGGFPAKGLQLHYHFGKLHLGHHVFQGLGGESLPTPFIPSAIMAHDAALSIFEMIANDEQLQNDLIGTPHYFHIMIAFAGHFMLEVCNKYSDQLTLDLNSDLSLIRNVLGLFERLPCVPQHPIRRMTPGLGQKLFDCSTKMNILLPAPLELHMQTYVPGMDQQPQTSFPRNYGDFQFPHLPDDTFMAHLGEFQFPDMSLHFTS